MQGRNIVLHWGYLAGSTQRIPSKRAFGPTGKPCLESHTRRLGITVHGAFPPFPTTKTNVVLNSGPFIILKQLIPLLPRFHPLRSTWTS